jgi:hypothetical protein
MMMKFLEKCIDWSTNRKERKKREREGERKKLEEESSRFMAARPTERQWRWIQKWARKLQQIASSGVRRFKNGIAMPRKSKKKVLKS